MPPSIRHTPRPSGAAAPTAVLRFVPLLIAAALAACGGGGGGSAAAPGSTVPVGAPVPSAPGPTPVPVATLPPSGNGVGLSAGSVTFTAVPGAPQSVAAIQSGNSGGFTVTTSTCAGIASVSPASGAGPFTFIALGPGTCSYLVTGSGGASAPVAVTVTTTAVSAQSVDR